MGARLQQPTIDTVANAMLDQASQALVLDFTFPRLLAFAGRVMRHAA